MLHERHCSTLCRQQHHLKLCYFRSTLRHKVQQHLYVAFVMQVCLNMSNSNIRNLHLPCRYASTCQTLGMNIGYFTSFTAFLALNDTNFCNNYLREKPQEEGILPLAGYLQFWGWFFVVTTILIALFKHETNFQPAGKKSSALYTS